MYGQVDLWSLKTPTLYTLHTDILLDGAVVDSYDTSFGIRDIRFDANEGFFLNGERVQIQGYAATKTMPVWGLLFRPAECVANRPSERVWSKCIPRFP